MDVDAEDFTELLAQHRLGDRRAHDRIVEIIYADLRRLAHRHVARNRWIASLDTTSVINESYLRLVSPAAKHVETRVHFLNLASQAMQQIICSYARRRIRAERRVDREVDVDEYEERSDAAVAQARQLVMVDDALQDLARVNARQAQVVGCRFFAGLSEEETASALAISLRTVQREWNQARTWLAENMRES